MPSTGSIGTLYFYERSSQIWFVGNLPIIGSREVFGFCVGISKLSQSSHARLRTKSTGIEDLREFAVCDEGNFLQLVFEWEAMAVGSVSASRVL